MWYVGTEFAEHLIEIGSMSVICFTLDYCSNFPCSFYLYAEDVRAEFETVLTEIQQICIISRRVILQANLVIYAVIRNISVLHMLNLTCVLIINIMHL